MDPNFNKNQNIEDSKPLIDKIDQIDQIDLKDKNTEINLNPNIKIIKLKKKGKISKHFIKKKRENPEEEINVNILNKSDLPENPYNTIVFLKNKIQKKINKKIKLEGDIQKMKIKLDKLKKYFRKL